MCNAWCYEFVTHSKAWWPELPTILEVGSLNVNGSPRDVCGKDITSYVGVDITPGPGVDHIISVEDLYPSEALPPCDVVISTEMLEHVHDWKVSLFNLMNMVKEGGILVLTTRSPGFEYHPYPEDNWRFVAEDFNVLFNSVTGLEPFKLLFVEPDPDKRNGISCGVGMIVQRTKQDLSLLQERLDQYEVHNVHTGTVGGL